MERAVPKDDVREIICIEEKEEKKKIKTEGSSEIN